MALAGGLRQPNFRLHPPAQMLHRRVTRMKEAVPSAQVTARSRTCRMQRNHGAVGEPRCTAGRHRREVFRPTFLFDIFVQSVLRARVRARGCRVGQPGRVPPSSASLWHGVKHQAAGLAHRMLPLPHHFGIASHKLRQIITGCQHLKEGWIPTAFGVTTPF